MLKREKHLRKTSEVLFYCRLLLQWEVMLAEFVLYLGYWERYRSKSFTAKRGISSSGIIALISPI
ncbi:hypothetical protein SAMN02745171_00819 [Porphyromonas circumdentaria]|uniref:Uncharacterized protein n=1 Tax=Porphyromonas circumdentaria TaxID=29524 RepID=A0A1T4MLU3_9PORP|nr:hypothetical protein [Porphyromonas circumdentaria]SJZ67786.1 hypothetical protein SAMN02745171_00819 [Porphyromonas circumdentaria]